MFASGFLSTPSARRATRRSGRRRWILCHFYPRPPRGGRLIVLLLNRDSNRYFYPRPPRGGRRSASLARVGLKSFLSTPSARRATPGNPAAGRIAHHFYPRPPRGGRRSAAGTFKHAARLSIHALREEGDGGRWLTLEDLLNISIHALREEGDARGAPRQDSERDVYPRPPRGGRLDGLHRAVNNMAFLSTPSARRATVGSTQVITPHATFLSTPSARRATSYKYFAKSVSTNFYPRPPRGGRQYLPFHLS